MPKMLTPTQRLQAIEEVIEDVERRCEVADGPVTPTLQEMTEREMLKIYLLASNQIRMRCLRCKNDYNLKVTAKVAQCPSCDRMTGQRKELD